MASKVTDKVIESGLAVKDRGVVLLDAYVPPSQREELSRALRGWAAHNPKLAAFLTAQVVLSGPPIILFFVFTLTVFSASLFVCILAALTLALAFTAFCTGLALLVLLPTLFVTTVSATFLFLAGIIGSAAISKFNNDSRTEGIRSRAKSNATAIGDKVKDASNGSIDLNTAAQHLADGVASSISTATSPEEAASEERAKQYLARQALGIPIKLENVTNGNPAFKQNGSGFDAATDISKRVPQHPTPNQTATVAQ